MALMRLPLGPILTCPESRAFLRATLDEVDSLARAHGVALPTDCAAWHFAALEQARPWTRSSMLNDVLAGRRLELDWLNSVRRRPASMKRLEPRRPRNDTKAGIFTARDSDTLCQWPVDGRFDAGEDNFGASQFGSSRFPNACNSRSRRII